MLEGDLGDAVADLVVSAADNEPRRGATEQVGLGVGQGVSGELLDEEPGIGGVAIEGTDHVVAIGPSVGPWLIHLVAMALAKPDHVEPVATPALAIRGGSEQAVDQRLIGVGRGVLEEGVDLVGSRRQTGEVKRRATDQRNGRGVGGEVEAVAFKFFEKEPIDRRANAIGTHLRRLDPLDGLKRPPVQARA